MGVLFDYLQGRGAPFHVIPHPPAEPTLEGVESIGLDPREVVRTEVLVTRDGYALLVIPAAEVVSLDLARAAVGDGEATVATRGQLEAAFPDYEPGALPPLGMLLQAPMYVDPEVVRRRSVTFSGGKLTVSIRMSTEDLFRGDPVVVTPLVERAPSPAADAG